MREMGAKMKYSPLKDTLDGKRVVMVDDSIVRGTTTDKLVRMLYDAGAREVHVRITAPPVKHPCFYGIDMANQERTGGGETFGRRDSPHDRRGTSLGYLSLEGVARAIGMGKDSFCRACFDGKYPIPVPPEVRADQNDAGKAARRTRPRTILKAAPTTVPPTTRNSETEIREAGAYFLSSIIAKQVLQERQP